MLSMKFIHISFCALLCFFAVSCGRGDRIESVEREDLFTLHIGKLEDEIAIFNLDGDRGIRRTGVFMKDGLFYISDGAGGKIQRYNSYGDLLFMIYNEETNPPPMTLKPFSEGNLVTRWAVPYPLREPGEITVDSRKHIYVRDSLPYERHSFDPESDALLSSVILHFDENGQFVDFLGREGVGGSPFPMIEGLYTSLSDELAVVCRVPTGWDIFWYDAEGAFLFVVQLKSEALPVPPERDDVFPSLDKISVAPDSRTLYIKIDYYRNTYDESTNIRTGIEPDGSVVWIMNAEDGLWGKYVDVPFFEYTFTEQNTRTTSRMLYSLLGAVSGGRLFLAFPVEGGYSLLIMPTETGAAFEQHKAFIRVNDEELQFNVFNLSADGILSGLLVDDYEIKLAWWRTDRFLEENFR